MPVHVCTHFVLYFIFYSSESYCIAIFLYIDFWWGVELYNANIVQHLMYNASASPIRIVDVELDKFLFEKALCKFYYLPTETIVNISKN